ncbi:hypothetical protein DSLASN_04860 [Desulfoluna limicola]|uniref:Right handed beta helix domain-containing protein n=1 Tax=Desulfoluna limicola TaxID=2810562 RepID=A0ABM7PBB4_9BACT|nr:right-handed parallel beta-helix repeat-containing protein [Desulfoluna limicola]BCS94854.1 hypothetical protein DSLASN_04860 [Desulfoluna limicola]
MLRNFLLSFFLMSLLVLTGCNLEGKVVTYDGNVLEGVTVSLAGDATAEVATNNDGVYLFEELKSGNYIVTPKLDGFRFTPSSVSVEITEADVSGIDFEAQPENVLRVPQDYSTIQAAVDAAVDNDTVVISDGTYTSTENVKILAEKRITIRSVNGPEKTIIDCQGNGIGIVVNNGVTISGLTVTNASRGGIRGNGTSTIENCIIKNNYGERHGGGLAFEYGSPRIENCRIEENSSLSGGGGISFSYGAPELINCLIINNTSQGYGGGITSGHSDVKISGGEIRLNRSEGDGGGAELSYGDCELSNVLIANNESATRGGGLARLYGSLLMENCKIRSNQAKSYGGGAEIGYGTQRIVNTLVDGNIAKDKGSGLSFIYSNPVILNCTIAHNTSTEYTDASGVWIRGSSTTTCEIANCIVQGNRGVQMDITNPGNLSVSYSNVGQDGIAGEGNINMYPSFTDGLYHLNANSPCVDSGKDTAVATDLDGVLRPQGNGFDMGAYEYVPIE